MSTCSLPGEWDSARAVGGVVGGAGFSSLAKSKTRGKLPAAARPRTLSCPQTCRVARRRDMLPPGDLRSSRRGGEGAWAGRALVLLPDVGGSFFDAFSFPSPQLPHSDSTTPGLAEGLQ